MPIWSRNQRRCWAKESGTGTPGGRRPIRSPGRWPAARRRRAGAPGRPAWRERARPAARRRPARRDRSPPLPPGKAASARDSPTGTPPPRPAPPSPRPDLAPPRSPSWHGPHSPPHARSEPYPIARPPHRAATRAPLPTARHADRALCLASPVQPDRVRFLLTACASGRRGSSAVAVRCPSRRPVAWQGTRTPTTLSAWPRTQRFGCWPRASAGDEYCAHVHPALIRNRSPRGGATHAAEDQAAIFEEFRQARGGTQSLEGTGLGLTLTKKFMELHGGKIRVTSEVGKGSPRSRSRSRCQCGNSPGSSGAVRLAALRMGKNLLEPQLVSRFDPEPSALRPPNRIHR